MHTHIKSTARKSTTVRFKYCPRHRRERRVVAPGRLPAEAVREGRREPEVASAGSGRSQSHPKGLERWAVPGLAMVLVAYALALIVRVISTYGP